MYKQKNIQKKKRNPFVTAWATPWKPIGVETKP